MARRAWITVTSCWAHSVAFGAVTVFVMQVCAAGQLFAQATSKADAHAESVAGIAELVDAGLPRGIWIPAALQPAVLRMLTRSPTFREQCEKLASYRSVHIGVAQNEARLRALGRGAMAEIRRYASGIVAVAITLPRGDTPYEALAHEVEHVLEFLDGLKLRALAASGARHTEVWLGPGGIETRRAIEAGQRVALEMNRPVIMTSAERGDFWK